MGTNYYAVPNRPSIYSGYHIGKSSFGWKFNFQVQDDPRNDEAPKWHTYPQVLAWLTEHVKDKQDYVIMDEYDKIKPLDEFIDLVQRKQTDPNCQNPDNFTYSENIDGYRFTREDFS